MSTKIPKPFRSLANVFFVILFVWLIFAFIVIPVSTCFEIRSAQQHRLALIRQMEREVRNAQDHVTSARADNTPPSDYAVKEAWKAIRCLENAAVTLSIELRPGTPKSVVSSWERGLCYVLDWRESRRREFVLEGEGVVAYLKCFFMGCGEHYAPSLGQFEKQLEISDFASHILKVFREAVAVLIAHSGVTVPGFPELRPLLLSGPNGQLHPPLGVAVALADPSNVKHMYFNTVKNVWGNGRPGLLEGSGLPTDIDFDHSVVKGAIEEEIGRLSR